MLLLHDDDGRRVLDVGGPGAPRWLDRAARRHAAEEAGEACGCSTSALTRAQSPGGHLVGADHEHRGTRRCTGCCSAGAAPATRRRSRVGRRSPSDDGRGDWRRWPRAGGPVGSRWTPVAATVARVRHRASGAMRTVLAVGRVRPVAGHRPGGGCRTARCRPPAHGAAPGRRCDGAGAGQDGERTERRRRRRAGRRAAAGPAADLAARGRRRRWPTCRRHRVRHAGARRARDDRPDGGRTCPPSCAARRASSWPPADAGVDPDALAAALLPVLRTPLGPLADGAALARHRRRGPAGRARLRAAARRRRRPERRETVRHARRSGPLLRRPPAGRRPARRRTPTGSAPPSWPAQPLRGYLTGSLDAVLRLPGPPLPSSPTTRPTGSATAGRPEPLTAVALPAAAALDEAMTRSDYPLQALLYCVALHRFLRWRQPGYDPAAAPRRRAVPVRARHVRAGHAGGRRRAVRRLRAGARRPRWSSSCRTCSTGATGDSCTDRRPDDPHDVARWRCAADRAAARRSTRPAC